MTIKELHNLVVTSIFNTTQVKSLFSGLSQSHILIQLNRWVKNGTIIRLRRGLYMFPDININEYAVASALYNPSYISLESALNHQGIIPDIPNTLTSVCTTTPRNFTTPMGKFAYSRIKTSLFFGYTLETDTQSKLPYSIAYPEKALLDLIYIRNYHKLTDLRVSWESLDMTRLKKYAKIYPRWVRQLVESYV